MTKIVNHIRAAVARARASQPFGAWIPNNKVLSATLAGGLIAAARALELVDLPAGWSEVVAAAVVGYLFPESPTAAAHVLVQDREKVERTRQLHPGFSDTSRVLERAAGVERHGGGR